MSSPSKRLLIALAFPLSLSGYSFADSFCTDLMDTSLNPLGPAQWPLYAHGHSAYATPFTPEQLKASYGQDINAYRVLKDYCLSGKGVHVAVVDSGLQIMHPSLAPNIDNRPYKSPVWSANYRQNRLKSYDPSPIEEDGYDHGTMVGGIIAMRSNQGFGGSGVAPRASLAGYNIINDDTQTFQNFYESLGGSDAAKGNDVFNMSYGFSSTSQISLGEPTLLASRAMYKTGTRLLRNGKGAIYVKASGNGFRSISAWDFGECDFAHKYNVSCQNVNMDPDNAMPEVLSVGALNAFGKKSSYSTTGSALWISMPGGEYGFNKTWIEEQYERFGKTPDWNSYRDTLGDPAVVSTDMMGARAGFSHYVNMEEADDIFDIRSEFNAGLLPENEHYNYTNSMNGTSSATPMASGAIAVLLEANPNLSWRDVKYILAKTATMVDPEFAGIKVSLPNGEFELEQGWVTNAAGYHFSNWYGFGRVNLEEAVNLALTYDYPLGAYVEQDWLPKGKKLSIDLEPGNLDGVVRVVNVPERQNLTVESVELLVSIKSGYVGNVAVELTSPSGTKNIVWHAGNGFSNGGNMEDMPLLTNAFYGEKSAGDWKVRLVNTGMENDSAKWTGFQLKVSGYEGK